MAMEFWAGNVHYWPHSIISASIAARHETLYEGQTPRANGVGSK